MATADLHLTFGAMYVCSVISVFLSGVGTLQTYQYFRTYRRKDSQLIGSTENRQVLAVWVLDLMHTIFICQGMWNYLILGWGDLQELDHLIWTVGASIAITGLITFIVHIFFAVRVWRFSKHKLWLGLLITSLAAVRLGSSIATTIEMIRLASFSAFTRNFRWLFTAGLALSCIIDFLLTGSLCYYLQVNRSGYSTMDEIIHRLLMYTISNGLLTAFASMLAMLFAALMPHNFLFIALHFIIAKCYMNSFLATLNSRDALKKRSDSTPGAVQISVEGHSQPRFRRFTSHHRPSPRGNDQAIPLSDVSEFTRGDGPVDMKVHIHVEQTVHDSDVEVERGISLDRSFKMHGLSSSEDEGNHTTLNLPRLTPS